MLEIKNLSILNEMRYLIKSLSLTLNKGDKLAIIGEEGNGKSTLLKSILGICHYATVTGTINFKGYRVGYLEQTLNESDLDKSAYEYLFISDENYYENINDLYKHLKTLKIDESILEKYMKNLSGGERVKICILKLLLEDDDILLLDEPTNDLDIETLGWLEKFILTTDKPIMYVSHDETLLSHTANMILHIEQLDHKTACKHTIAKTDYESYIKDRLNMLDKQTQIAKSEKREFNKKREKLRQIMQKVEYQQNTISRNDPFGAKILKKKMHTLKSQEKKLNNLNLTEIPDVEESIDFFFEEVTIPNSKTILKLEMDELKIEDRVLSKNINLEIVGPEHICIIGKNGVGKTTLIKIIYDKLKDRTDIKVGYMPQNYEDLIDNEKQVLDFLTAKNKDDITTARTLLGSMNFTKDEMIGKIGNLSNGSKTKLFLVKLVLEKCNVLILDEPTRNLSPLSNPVIRKVLKEFKGAIISISHDRKFLSEVIDAIYTLDEKGMIKTNYFN